MSQGRMIFLTGRSWSIRLGWQRALGACLAAAILFASGCAKVAVPNVEGLTQDAATTAITGAKLIRGTVTQQTSNTVATGKVISQDPANGSSLAEGFPVNLVISSGPQMVTVPNVEGFCGQAVSPIKFATVLLHMGQPVTAAAIWDCHCCALTGSGWTKAFANLAGLILSSLA